MRTILGCPVTEEIWADANIPPLSITYDFELLVHDMDDNLIAIFGSGGSGNSPNTTNGGQFTWTWPVGAGNTVNPNPPSTLPVATQTLYRRSTHDENGNAKQFTKEQEQLWKDLAAIATMTSLYIWKTAEEIYKDTTDYQKRTRTSGVYLSLDSVKTSLETLVANGMLEEKSA